jgi:predicted Zn-dependent peptidase
VASDRPFFKTILDNGIRVVAEQVPAVKSVSLGIWVEAGSRDEEDPVAGISHFAEHMFFKGTRRRNAFEIAQEMDGLGGELNAFTSRETTTFYVKVLDEHLDQAVGILGDLFHHSLFDPAEIEREKQVILEEIKMVEDDPEDLIHDLHTQNLWKGSPLGRPILGEAGTVKRITRPQILTYLSEHYHPERTVIAAAGNFSPSHLMTRLNRVFGRTKPRSKTMPDRQPPTINGRFLIKRKPLMQVHLCLGLKGLPLTHPDRYAAYTLNALLGGSMSSRLFQEIRERRGLVYSIYSHLSGFRDAGLFTLYAAAGEAAADQVLRLILKELKRLRMRGVGRDELERTLNHVKGAIMLSLESTSSRMSRLAKDEIYFGRYFALKEILGEIKKINRRQIHRLAEELLDPRVMSLTLLGPLSSPPKSAEPLFS